MPCYNAILTGQDDDRDLRHEVYIAYGTRASNRGPPAKLILTTVHNPSYSVGASETS